MTKAMPLTANDDSELVALSRDGNREAFGQIVSRYQSLICSLAYSATGSLSRSEDLAQETFLTAWRQLEHLREPGKLRSWLCGIARNLIRTERRDQQREPTHAAEPLDQVQETPAREPLPLEEAITREEEAILWRALDRIPELYREPLVLYYREHQSVERVAQALELSEDAVKQRLARGRKMLEDQVAAFVQGALGRSAPGAAFTMGILAALPAMTAPAHAVGLGAAAGKVSGLLKASSAFAGAGVVLAAILGPILGIAGGWLGTKASLEGAQSDRERRFIKRVAWMAVGLSLTFTAALCFFVLATVSFWRSHGVGLSLLMGGTVAGFVILLFSLIFWSSRGQARIRLEEAAKLPPEAIAQGQAGWPLFEYRSQWRLFGLPLIHIRTGRRVGEKLRPATGWIAIGDAAAGIILAIGGVAVGGISIGGASLGVISVGGAAVGLLACGGLGIGIWSAAGLAVGCLASGGCAIAWQAAQGGSAIAHDFALGGAAFARHANDEAARAFIAGNSFLSMAGTAMRSGWLQVICFLPLGLVVWQAVRARKMPRR